MSAEQRWLAGASWILSQPLSIYFSAIVMHYCERPSTPRGLQQT